MNKILTRILDSVQTMVETYPSHLYDESLIKHKIIQILLDEIDNPYDIKNLQIEKTCKISNVNRCDIFFQFNNEKVFLELKLNRLVLKISDDKLSGGNVFSGDILAILKDFDQMKAINYGEKYLFLLMQNRGVKINMNYKRSLNEYSEEKQTKDSIRLMSIIENRDESSEVLADKIIQGKVNGIQVPFRMLLFKIK